MRSDMAKVLVERPRSGGWSGDKGYRKRWRKEPPEDWRGREGMKARWRGNTKWFGDHLGPIRRFLRSNVGRPWDTVYAEICAELRSGFPVREHFLRHIFDYVARHVILVDGIPCSGEGRDHGQPLGLFRRKPFYVCPRSGLLRAVPELSKRQRRSFASP